MKGITPSQALRVGSEFARILMNSGKGKGSELQRTIENPVTTEKAIRRAVESFFSAAHGVSNFGIPILDLSAYRAIDGLIVIGPEEIEKAFLGPKGENPHGLQPNWCQEFAIDLPKDWTPEFLSGLVELCRTPEWNTTPVLWLALPEISLVKQYEFWGVQHDEQGPGEIRTDTMWSNWFNKNQYQWAIDPAVTEPTWKIGYELPRWSTRKNWKDQQIAAKERGLEITSVASDALMMNLVAVATGKRLRTATWARTATICDGQPLYVYFSGNGLDVDHDWISENVIDDLGAAVEGVPSELVS